MIQSLIRIARFSSVIFILFWQQPVLLAQSDASLESEQSSVWPPEVFPNPTGGPVRLDLGSEYEDVNIRIWNRMGEQVHQEYHRIARFLELTIPGDPGEYVLEINTSITKTVRLRLTKE